jgi:putative thioredoxin
MRPPTTSWIIDVGEDDFEQNVLEASRHRPVVVDFWAPWCGPCKALAPVLEEVVNERKGEVILAKVNVDEAPNIAGALRIEAIPAVKAFRDGQVVLQFEGVLPEAHLRQFIERILPTDAEQLTEKARDRDDPVQSEKLYREALARDKDNQEARVGLAEALLAQNKTKEIPDLLEPVALEGELGTRAERIKARLALAELARSLGTEAEARRRLAANPTSSQARYELACVLAAGGQLQPALDMLIGVAEQDANLAPTKVRDAMVKIFYVLGTDHPLANDYRAKLARLLF